MISDNSYIYASWHLGEKKLSHKVAKSRRKWEWLVLRKTNNKMIPDNSYNLRLGILVRKNYLTKSQSHEEKGIAGIKKNE